MAIKIYIDQGHNPVNPNAGSEGNGLREQDIVYRIGKELEALLDADGDFDVRVSRPSEDTLLGTSNASSLRLRVEDANNWGADYFLSLHTNASVNTEASGSEAFVYSRNGEAYILSEIILSKLNAFTRLRNRGVKIRPSLYVLRRTRMPAALIELGFITNYNDALLMSREPGLFAEAIYEALLEYFGID